MKQLQMLYIFVKISQEIIPDIDEIDIEYDIRHNQIDFDERGPICSDSVLIDIFNNATKNKYNGNELYTLIEKICLEYVNKIKE